MNRSCENDAEGPTIWYDILRSATDEAVRLGAAQHPNGVSLTVSALLGVISYCYSKGVVSSCEIEHELWKNPKFLESFGDRLPSAQQLRNFRRRHRSAILTVIARAHREFWKREALRKGDTQLACREAERVLDDACFADTVEFE